MQPGAEQDRSFIEAARRIQIVDAAIAVIATNGLVGSSFARIAREASISPALISYHFGSREELLREILSVADARMDRAMSGAPDEPASYTEALRGILVGYVKRCASHPAEVMVARAIRESAPREIQEARDEHRDGDGAAEMVEFLIEGQEHGEFRQFDPAVFTDALFAAMSSVPRQVQDRTVEELAALAEQFASIFVHAAVELDERADVTASAAEKAGRP